MRIFGNFALMAIWPKAAIGTASALALAFVFSIDGPRAQDSNNEDLLACDLIEDQREKLKCFNDIVNNLRRQIDGQPASTPRTDDNVDQGQDSAVTGDRSAANERTPRTSPNNIDNFGFPDSEESKITLVMGVNRFWYSYRDKLVVELTNGQIWMETSGSKYHARPRERSVDPHTLTVEIKEGRVGGYRLKIQGKKGFARVRRIR